MSASRLDLSGVVGAEIAAAPVKAFLDAHAGAAVDIHVNSPGGFVFEGLEIYNAVRDHGQVTMIVDSLAASAASLIAMGAERIVMKPGALMMIHRAAAMTLGNAEDHRQSADVLDKIDNQVVGIYASRSGMTRKRVADLLDKESWFNGEEATAAGLADQAEEASSGNDAPARASLNFKVDIRNLYRNPPRALFALLAKDIDSMTTPKTAPNPEAAPADVTGDILSRAATARLSAVETAEIVAKAGGNIEKARDLIIDAMAARDTQPRVVVGNDAGGDPDGHAAAIGEAIAAKLAGRTAAGPFAGMTAPALAGEWLRGRGVTLRSHDATSIVRQAMGTRQPFMNGPGFHTTSDFPTILGDQMQKSLANLFAAAESGASKIAGVGTMPDFRERSIGKLSSFPELLALGEGGEIKWGTLEESGEKISVATFARALSISFELLVNDNLGGVQRSLRDIAFAATNLKAKLIIDALLTTAMSDGKTLFHADHANIVTGDGADKPTVPSLDAVRQLMRQQKAIDGTTVLGLSPRTILVPSSLETQAQIVATATTPVSTADVNPFSGLAVAVEPRLDAVDATSWYGFVDPAVLPAVEFDTLEGTPVPRLEIADPADFSRLGAAYRVWWAAGAAPVEYRAAVKNPGA